MRMTIVFRDGRTMEFDGVESFTVTEEQTASQEHHATEVAQSPIEGRPFEVNPLQIDRSLFEKPREDQKQEEKRQIIQEAFVEADKQPEKYAEPFCTLIPAKAWDGYKTTAELEQYALDLGGQMTDWIEKALEWAQRICNGETWKAVCNDADTAKWYRMIVWKNGFKQLVGGSRKYRDTFSTSDIGISGGLSVDRLDDTVPSVTLRKK